MPTRRNFLQTTALAGTTLAGFRAGADDSTTARPNEAMTGADIIKDSTPLADGFFMPGEEGPHEATLMVFPPEQNWKGYGLNEARKEWAEVANAIAEFEPVRMVVHPRDLARARKLLDSSIELMEFPVNDGWARDTAPLFLTNDQGERRASGMIFNGWGAKFPPFSDDALLKARLCAHLDVPFYPIDVVGEGGGVLVDGEGTIIVTEQCLLHKNRNPKLDQATVEKRLLAGFGATKCIWLGRGLTPDPVTDGHVDGMAAYVKPGLLLLHRVDDKNDPNVKILADAKRRLAEVTDAKGRQLEVVELPLASEVSQMNFYLCNGAVIVPTAGTEEDDEPLGILKEMFPDREIVPVSGNILGEGGGGVHCITQQIPG